MRFFTDDEQFKDNNQSNILSEAQQAQFQKQLEQSEQINQKSKNTFNNFIQDPQYRPTIKVYGFLKKEPQINNKDILYQNSRLGLVNYIPKNTGQQDSQQNKQNKNFSLIAKSNRSQIITQKIASYPTKNFLQAFKIIFYKQIHRALGQSWIQIPHLKAINDKNGINLSQFLKILKTPILKEHFTKYFKTQKILRDLLKSRIKYSKKMIYFSRIHRFQQAFESGEFDHIN